MGVPLHILHACPGLSITSGGPARSVTALVGALSQSGIEVTLVRGRRQDEVDFPQKATSAFLLNGEVVSEGNERATWSLVHSHGLWLPFNHQIARLAESPHVVSPRGMLEPWAMNNSKWKKRAAWWLYQRRDLRRAVAFHATAKSEAESIRRLGFKQPIAVIQNGIFLPQVSTKERKAGKPETETKTAFFLSRIHPKKGLPMLLDAWKRVAPPDWRLVIAGNDDGNHLPAVERKIRELGLSGRVSVVGPLFGEAKEKAFHEADLFVLPSYSENFGIVVTEALGYRVPVLTTTGCPWRELQIHDCGWWVDPTPGGIEEGLRQALGTKLEALDAMGRRGRQLVEEKYQWPGIAERMAEFYEWLLNGGPQPQFVQ